MVWDELKEDPVLTGVKNQIMFRFSYWYSLCARILHTPHYQLWRYGSALAVNQPRTWKMQSS